MGSLLGLLALLALAPSAPKYIRLKLHELIARADLCIIGHIVSVSPETVEVSVEEVGFGEPGGELVHIRRFLDWACASRWQPYAVGQRCLYFLEAESGCFSILGSGGEGETPVGPNGPTAFKYPNFLAETRRYREHFKLGEGQPRGLWIEPIASEEEIETYRRSSPLAERLVMGTFARTLGGHYLDPSARSPRPAEPGRVDLGIFVAPNALLAVPDLDEDGWSDLVVAQGRYLWLLRRGPQGELCSRERLRKLDPSSLAPLGTNVDGEFSFVAAERDAMSFLVLEGNGQLRELGTIATRNLDSLVALGDLDGDGVVELASRVDEEWNDEIRLLSMDEETRRIQRRVGLTDSGHEIRSPSLAAPGDIDGDGVPDLAYVSQRYAKKEWKEELHVVFLHADGTARACSRHLGDDEESFGPELVAPGDCDSDGVPDLVVAHPEHGLRVLLLARDGTVRRSYLVSMPAGPLPDSGSFGEANALVVDLDGPRLLCGGLGAEELSPGSTWRTLRRYPSIWSWPLADLAPKDYEERAQAVICRS